jgi:hypothetical protein
LQDRAFQANAAGQKQSLETVRNWIELEPPPAEAEPGGPELFLVSPDKNYVHLNGATHLVAKCCSGHEPVESQRDFSVPEVPFKCRVGCYVSNWFHDSELLAVMIWFLAVFVMIAALAQSPSSR